MTRTVQGSPICITVRAVSMLREIIGGSFTFYLDSGSTIGDLIKRLDEKYGPVYMKEVGETLGDSIMKSYNMSVNGGKIIRPSEHVNRRLNDNDELVFLQWVGGG